MLRIFIELQLGIVVVVVICSFAIEIYYSFQCKMKGTIAMF